MEAVVTRKSLRRRITRRPRYHRDDLRIEIRDDYDDGEYSSGDDYSPSPSSSSYPPGVTQTHSPKAYPPKTTLPPPPPPPPPPVLAPADPTEVMMTSKSSTPPAQPTQVSRAPSYEQPRSTSLPYVASTTQSSTTTRSLPTAIPNSLSTTTNLAIVPTGGSTRDGNQAGLGNARSYDTGWTPTAIAFGTIAIASLFLVIGWGLWWFLRYRKRRQARMMGQRSMSPDGNHWNPRPNVSAPSQPIRRAPSSVMAELIGAAYAAENGNAGYGPDRSSLTPQGYLDEKRHDPARQLPILEPAPVHQPNVRNSIASWIRRHHPLKLNPLSGRSSVYSNRTMNASALSVDVPPVPAVPDAYRPASQHSAQANDNRYTSSTGSETNSILALYENQQQPRAGHEKPPQPLWLETPPPLVRGDRGISMAPTEATTKTESTWRTWGGGVTQPREHAQSPPETPRRGWIEKCIKFGGLK